MEEELKVTLGNNLKYIRWQKNWSQAFVCRQIGISIRTLSRAETGCGISRYTLNKLCGLYQVPMNCFYQDKKKEVSTDNRVDLIPESVMTKMIMESDLLSNIQREAVLRFNDCLQKDALMMREDIEKVLPDIVNDKKAYSLQELISVAMAVNQITIRNIGNMAVA